MKIDLHIHMNLMRRWNESLFSLNLWTKEWYCLPPKETNSGLLQEGRGISIKTLNKNLETPNLAPAQFSHLPGFYLKTGILNPSPFLDCWNFEPFLKNLRFLGHEISSTMTWTIGHDKLYIERSGIWESRLFHAKKNPCLMMESLVLSILKSSPTEGEFQLLKFKKLEINNTFG